MIVGQAKDPQRLADAAQRIAAERLQELRGTAAPVGERGREHDPAMEDLGQAFKA